MGGQSMREREREEGRACVGERECGEGNPE